MTDELNWLAVYFKEGPKPPQSPTGNGSLQYTSYLENFDDYFLFLAGARTKSARRPSQQLPGWFERLVNAFETSGQHGFTEATEFLYELDQDERRKLSSTLREFLATTKKERRTHMTVQFPEKAVRLEVAPRQGATIQAEAERLSQGMKREVLVVAINPKRDLSIAGWGVSKASALN
jgi:hypothetical protein